MRYADKILVIALLLAVRPGYAAEFEVIDKLAVNGAATFLSSATIVVPVTQSASLWASTSAVTPHLFVSTSGNIGVGTADPGAKLEVAGQVKITGGAPGAGKVLTSDGAGLAAWGTISGDNLGNHVATTTLNMATFNIVNIGSITANAAITTYSSMTVAGDITAARYQINGSTVLAIGSYNVFVGPDAGRSRTTGLANNFLGDSAGYSNTSGSYNVGMGYGVSWYNQTGSANVTLGDGVGFGVSGNSFSSSTLIGYRAGYGLTTGSDNVLLGFRAGDMLTSGSRNIIVGYDQDPSAAAASNELNIGGVLFGNLSARTIGISTRVPQAALDIVSTGTLISQYAQIWRDSTGLAVASMTATGKLYTAVPPTGDNMGNHVATTTLQMGVYGVNTSSNITAARYQINGSTMVAILPGTDSIAYGVYAGTSNIVGGNFNIFIGNYAGTSNTTADYNSFLGGQAGYSNTTGSYSAFVGYMAGRTNTTGNYNSFLGFQAGYANTTGYNNSFIGSNAGYANTTGNENSFLGYWAGYTNTTGAHNSFLGSYAGRSNTTGADNSFLGYMAGYRNTTGGYNSFLGYQAGYYNQVGAGNAVIGYSAGGYGAGAVNSFSSSTIMGYQAGYNVTTGNDNILLGWQAGYNVTSGAGNIVIGYNKDTSAPAASDELNIGGVLYGDLSAKTIGISTRVPQAALDIVSTGTASNIYAQIWRNGAGAVVASMTSQGTLYAAIANGDNLGDHTATRDLDLAGHDLLSVSTMSISTITVPAGVAGLSFTTNTFISGALGVGTTAPGTYKLYVVGNGYLTGSLQTGLDMLVAGGDVYDNGGDLNLSGEDNVLIKMDYNNDDADIRSIIFAKNTGLGVLPASDDELMRITEAGDVGISTGAPQARLDIRSSGSAPEIMAQLWRDSSGAIVSSVSATGVIMASRFVGDGSGLTGVSGDNLGNHVATTTLNMDNFEITAVSTITVSSITTSGSGVVFSTNVFITRGNVGIGTTGPNASLSFGATVNTNKLYLYDAGAAKYGLGIAAGTLQIYAGATPATNKIAFGTYDGSTFVETVRFQNNGNVGISSAAPSYRLVVSSGAGEAGTLMSISTGTSNVIWMTGSGEVHANRFYGDVSGASGLPAGDNLGNHVATTTLQMGVYGVNTSSNITAARYQINGSTMMARLPGTDSIAYGVNAGSSNITGGNYNTFIGNQAGAANTTGDNNTANGYRALYSNTTGGGNTANGYGALLLNTTGGGNTANGSGALQLNTTGVGNTANGNGALGNNTVGVGNTANGNGAQNANTTGSNNTAYGYDTLLNNQTGSANSVFGTHAGGYAAILDSFSSATIMGYEAGANLTTGSDNILLGFKAGYSVTTGTRNIIIGYDLGPSAATANNEINIGNVYKGLVSSGTATIPKFTVQAEDSGITVTAADFGKTITVNSASAQTVTLPSVTAADTGATITVIKLGAGTVTIDAPAGAYIADSGSGGTIYNNIAAETYATITLRLATSTMWAILGGNGSWTTTN